MLFIFNLKLFLPLPAGLPNMVIIFICFYCWMLRLDNDFEVSCNILTQTLANETSRGRQCKWNKFIMLRVFGLFCAKDILFHVCSIIWWHTVAKRVRNFHITDQEMQDFQQCMMKNEVTWTTRETSVM